MEVAGFAIGIAGLAGLFSTCLDLMDKIIVARDAREDYQAAFSNFQACKILFEEWGKGADIDSGEPKDPDKRKAAYHILATIEQLFTNASKLESRYGVSVPVREEASEKSEKSKSSMSLAKRARWAVRDKQKFDDLTALLATFTERLGQLVPVKDKMALEMKESLASLKDLMNGEISFCCVGETSIRELNVSQNNLRSKRMCWRTSSNITKLSRNSSKVTPSVAGRYIMIFLLTLDREGAESRNGMASRCFLRGRA